MYLLVIPAYQNAEFISAPNRLGSGRIGGYVWRAFENTEGGPQALVMERIEFSKSNRSDR